MLPRRFPLVNLPVAGKKQLEEQAKGYGGFGRTQRIWNGAAGS